jgi:hypothetical protein
MRVKVRDDRGQIFTLDILEVTIDHLTASQIEPVTTVVTASTSTSTTTAVTPPMIASSSIGPVIGGARVVAGSGPVSFGVPFALGAVKVNDSLALYQNGVKVTSSARQIARWPDGSSKWMLFSATAIPSGSFEVRKEQPLTPDKPISVVVGSTTISVNTGDLTFVVDGKTLFGSVTRNSTSKVEATGAPISFIIAGVQHTLGTQRELKVAFDDGITAVITAEHDLVGGQPNLGLRRVYKFRAGSGLIDVRCIVMHYASRYSDGVIIQNGVPNGVMIDKATIELMVPGIINHHVQAAGQTSSGTGVASVEQLQRSANGVAYAFNMMQGGSLKTGTLATDAQVQVQTVNGCIRMFSPDLAYMEPQKLWTSTTSIGFDFISNHIWVGAKQGMAAEFVVDFCATPSVNTQRPVVLPLNVAATNALELSPMQSIATEFNATMTALVKKSITLRESKGLLGFMTYGGQPRYWGDPAYGDEIGISSPTGQVWDRVYWGSTWTDYHNAAESVTLHAISVLDHESFTKWSVPAALRMLYTQMYQARPGDTSFYSWAAPAGYNGFRSDMNSSHQYWGNLFTYYYLTGDTEVTRALKASANNFRNYYCSTRPGAACGIDVKPRDQWAGLNSRVFSQWQRAFRFVGETVDASYWEDWIANEARSLKQVSVTVASGPDGKPMSAWLADQLWMAAGYDMRNMMLYAQDLRASGKTSDADRVDAFLVGWVKTMLKYASADGKPGSRWANALSFETAGVATTPTSTSITVVTQNTSGGDPYLYSSGKAMMLRLFWYAAQRDVTLAVAFQEWLTFALTVLKAEVGPLSKSTGICLTGMSGIIS